MSRRLDKVPLLWRRENLLSPFSRNCGMQPGQLAGPPILRPWPLIGSSEWGSTAPSVLLVGSASLESL